MPWDSGPTMPESMLNPMPVPILVPMLLLILLRGPAHLSLYALRPAPPLCVRLGDPAGRLRYALRPLGRPFLVRSAGSPPAATHSSRRVDARCSDVIERMPFRSKSDRISGVSCPPAVTPVTPPAPPMLTVPAFTFIVFVCRWSKNPPAQLLSLLRITIALASRP